MGLFITRVCANCGHRHGRLTRRCTQYRHHPLYQFKSCHCPRYVAATTESQGIKLWPDKQGNWPDGGPA